MKSVWPVSPTAVGHPVDGAVDELPVVELVLADVLLVERVPGLLDEPELGRRGRAGDAGSGIAPPGVPEGIIRRPTPIPALNVTTNARPTIAPMSAARPPWPAAGDV